MSALSLSERLIIHVRAVEHTRRRFVARTLTSPFLRWRYGAAAADQILIVPQELRSTDPSFWFEVQHGHFGLASEIADLKGASPFRVPPPTIGWARELHGFGWLRHLAASEDEDAFNGARAMVLDWIASQRSSNAIAYEPAVVARRIISWITQANMLLEGADAKAYSQIMSSLSQQVAVLNANWRNAPEGVPRLVSLIGLTLANLAISNHDRTLRDTQRNLIEELRRQTLADGGHASRNASVLADLVLDLLPLGQCFQARGFAPPEEFAATVKKALAFLRYMRLGDGMLARFNGVSTGAPATIATVLAYCDGELDAVSAAEASGYARLEGDETILIADVGSPPKLELATVSEAGCLSFEVSIGNKLLFVNGGHPGPADADWNPIARATVSHNTLCLGETSSARLVRHEQLQQITGGLPIRGPDLVVAKLSSEGSDAVLVASHDGYLKRYGLLHNRRLTLSRDGRTLSGLDRLQPPSGRLRLKMDVPYSVHFHLHPECRVKPAPGRGRCVITMPGGRRFIFEVDTGEAFIEESTYFVESTGPRRSLQIVLRGTTFGETEIRWRVRADRIASTGDGETADQSTAH
ncbi:MAG: heparinase II/III family protein [Hyphomicrobium sp.]